MELQVGFVGTGYIAREHMQRIIGRPQVRVTALCDIDAEKARSCRADILGAGSQARIYTSVRDMLSAEQLSALFICLPPSAHGEAELAAIEAGLPFLVEKPVALNLPLALRIADEADQRGLVTAAGYQTRYSDMIPYIQQTLAGRPVVMALAHRFSPFPAAAWYREADLSGGQVVEMATHQVDLLRLLVSEISTVYAVGGRLVHTSDPAEIFDAEAACFTFASGAIGSLTTNLISGHGKPALAKGMHLFADGITVSIIGYEGGDRVVEVVQNKEMTETTFADDSMAAQDAAFLDAVAGHEPRLVRCSYRDATRTLAVTLAHQASARTGMPVAVDDLLTPVAGNEGR
jgi:myo-inositol 2-dehydrogenase / D-chiro-inositol 1-dehydrogenase